MFFDASGWARSTKQVAALALFIFSGTARHSCSSPTTLSKTRGEN